MVGRAAASLLAAVVPALLGAARLDADPCADLAYLISGRAAMEGAAGGGSGPLQTAVRRAAEGAAATTNELELVLNALLFVYQAFVSSQDRPTCMYSPTCSQYARMAIRRYGIIRGVLMASDRLQRCNGFPSQTYPLDSSGKRLDPP